ncbi:helix-turn-helix domain-containing protein [Halarcobacter bivalviorum]|nr:AraC family transcriptional regulator [Halarcobacter bivalviorum]AXH13133.1 transcriptional regulator, AraC family [Halarcobacter bivalviorum]
MSYKVDLKNFDEFMLKTDDSETINFKLPKNMGSFSSTKEIINKDVLLFKTNTNIKESLTLNSKSFVSGLSIIINLEGEFKYFDKSNKSALNVRKNSVITKYVNKYDSVMNFDKNSKSSNLCLILRDEFLEKYFLNKIENRDELFSNYENNISTDFEKRFENYKVVSLAKELYNSPFEGELNDLYTQSKVFELIYEELTTIVNEHNNLCTCGCSKINHEDRIALYKAKELIEKADAFYTLEQLCKKVAINEFKLKLGFKELFDTTPGALVLKTRMDKAKILLSSGEYNIAEVSNLVGYKYQQSFSTAFFRHYGVLPKDLIKKRKYY